MEVKSSDLDNTAQLGFIDGISKIFIDNLKQLSIYERPIHCTDMKRETMYIKDEDTWQKENNDIRLRGAIQEVGPPHSNKFSSRPKPTKCPREVAQREQISHRHS